MGASKGNQVGYVVEATIRATEKCFRTEIDARQNSAGAVRDQGHLPGFGLLHSFTDGALKFAQQVSPSRRNHSRNPVQALGFHNGDRHPGDGL